MTTSKKDEKDGSEKKEEGYDGDADSSTRDRKRDKFERRERRLMDSDNPRNRTGAPTSMDDDFFLPIDVLLQIVTDVGTEQSDLEDCLGKSIAHSLTTQDDFKNFSFRDAVKAAEGDVALGLAPDGLTPQQFKCRDLYLLVLAKKQFLWEFRRFLQGQGVEDIRHMMTDLQEQLEALKKQQEEVESKGDVLPDAEQEKINEIEKRISHFTHHALSDWQNFFESEDKELHPNFNKPKTDEAFTLGAIDPLELHREYLKMKDMLVFIKNVAYGELREFGITPEWRFCARKSTVDASIVNALRTRSSSRYGSGVSTFCKFDTADLMPPAKLRMLREPESELEIMEEMMTPSERQRNLDLMNQPTRAFGYIEPSERELLRSEYLKQQRRNTFSADIGELKLQVKNMLKSLAKPNFKTFAEGLMKLHAHEEPVAVLYLFWFADCHGRFILLMSYYIEFSMILHVIKDF